MLRYGWVTEVRTLSAVSDCGLQLSPTSSSLLLDAHPPFLSKGIWESPQWRLSLVKHD